MTTKLVSTGVEFPDATTQTTTGLPLTGGTMTGTVAGFTSTGIDDNATSTAITIDSSENVGIGTTTPDGKLHVHTGSAGAVTAHTVADDFVLEGSADVGMSLLTPDANKSRIILGTPTDYVSAHMSWDYTTLTHSIGTDITGGDVVITSGNSVETARFPSTGGITFNGDTAAANALDDYEEGTFTPIFSSTVGSFTSITYSSFRFGKYVKVGSLVTAYGYIRSEALTIGTAAGNLLIDGLPFTLTTGLPYQGQVAVSRQANVGSATLYGGNVNDATDNFMVYKNLSGTALTPSDLSTSAASNQIGFVVTYRV